MLLQVIFYMSILQFTGFLSSGDTSEQNTGKEPRPANDCIEEAELLIGAW